MRAIPRAQRYAWVEFAQHHSTHDRVLVPN
jgi:hypothetical protein